MNISVVVLTMNRPKELAVCIDALMAQTFLPHELLIIDDGDLTMDLKKEIQDKIEKNGVSFRYIKKSIPGTSTSRNMGANQAKSPIILYVDDDVVLAPDYVKILNDNWERHFQDPRLGGIGGMIKNLRPFGLAERVFHRFFCLSSATNWDVTNVGYQVWNPAIKTSEKGYYLPVGISSFRKTLLTEIPFLQLSPGRSPGEDVDLSLRAKKAGYYFILDPQATLVHNESPISRDQEFNLGVKEGINQVLIFEGNCEKDFLGWSKFAWSSIGWILRQFFGGRIQRSLGMLYGYAKGAHPKWIP